MSRYVTDTHPLLWHIKSDPRLSVAAQSIFLGADAGTHQVLVPSIVLVESTYLVEKSRLDPAVLRSLTSLLRLNPGNYSVASLDFWVVQTLRSVPRDEVPDMPDRIIAATAMHYGVGLITKDAAIQSATCVTTIW